MSKRKEISRATRDEERKDFWNLNIYYLANAWPWMFKCVVTGNSFKL